MPSPWRKSKRTNVVYVQPTDFSVSIRRQRSDGFRYLDQTFVLAVSWKDACRQMERDMKRNKQRGVVLGAWKLFPESPNIQRFEDPDE